MVNVSLGGDRMKVLVTGVKGQLGFDVIKALKKRGHEAIGVDIEEMNLIDNESVHRVICSLEPKVVIHCAAFTAVDDAEETSNREQVMNINGIGTEYVAKACKEIDAKMIYISTDYVFDGKGSIPWQPDDKQQPLNVYGLSKYEGELAVEKWLERAFIIRIAWVFGKNGKNFVKTMLDLGKTRGVLNVVNDQIGTPTYTYDLANLLVDFAESEAYGKYHVTNEGGYISWYDFACEIMRQAGMINPSYQKVVVSPVSSETYPTKANRPINSKLDKSKLVEQGFTPLPIWQDALGRYLKEIGVE